jgi:hypothetical protein
MSTCLHTYDMTKCCPPRRFLAQIPSPLGLGTVLLEDGTTVKGFIGESFALKVCPDVLTLAFK